MRISTFIVSLGLSTVLFLSGCDSVDPTNLDRAVHPTISVYFVNGPDVSLQKNQTVLDVELVVTTVSGAVYSPDPVKVDDAIDSEVTFDLVLPPDSVYRFEVLFRQGGQLVAEGAVLQLITEESAQVTIPVVSMVDGPWLALVPSIVERPRGAGTFGLDVRYYGDSQDIAGIAARMNVTGPNRVAVEFEQATVLESSDSQISIAWQFGDPISGVKDIDTIVVPLSGVAEFCLDVSPGDTRIVDRQGGITIIGGSGACIEVK